MFHGEQNSVIVIQFVKHLSTTEGQSCSCRDYFRSTIVRVYLNTILVAIFRCSLTCECQRGCSCTRHIRPATARSCALLPLEGCCTRVGNRRCNQEGCCTRRSSLVSVVGAEGDGVRCICCDGVIGESLISVSSQD